MKRQFLLMLVSIVFCVCSPAYSQLAVSCENVKTFGAKGDGSTDDTDDIQSAINQAQISRTYTVCLPPGQYVINRPLVAASGSLSGSYLTIVGSSSMWAYDKPTASTTIIQGSLWNSGSSQNALIDMRGATQVRVGYLQLYCITNAPDGLDLGNAKSARVDQITVYGCNRGIYARNGGLGIFSDNQVTNNNYGIELDGYGDSQLVGNYANTNKTFHIPTAYNDLIGTGIYLNRGSGNVNIIGGKLEWNARGIVVYASQGVNISDVQFDTNMAGHIFGYADFSTTTGIYNTSITVTGNRFLGGGQNDASGGAGPYHRVGIIFDARVSTKVSAVITGNSFRAGARCAYDNNKGTNCGRSGPPDAAIYANEMQSGTTNVVVTGNDLMDASSTHAVIANGSGTRVKFTGNLTDLPNSALGGGVITTP
jgi:parallel beta-helix repeat protein